MDSFSNRALPTIFATLVMIFVALGVWKLDEGDSAMAGAFFGATAFCVMMFIAIAVDHITDKLDELKPKPPVDPTPPSAGPRLARTRQSSIG